MKRTGEKAESGEVLSWAWIGAAEQAAFTRGWKIQATKSEGRRGFKRQRREKGLIAHQLGAC